MCTGHSNKFKFNISNRRYNIKTSDEHKHSAMQIATILHCICRGLGARRLHAAPHGLPAPLLRTSPGSIKTQCSLTNRGVMSSLDNWEERRHLFLAELVVSSKLYSVVVQVQQYCTQRVFFVIVDLEYISQLPTKSHTHTHAHTFSRCLLSPSQTS